MKLPTRLQIIEYIRKHQIATAHELSSVFNLTGANIRYHLAYLEEYHFVEVIGHRKLGKGRPENVYGFSPNAQGDGLDVLSSSLLKDWLGFQADRGKTSSLRMVARSLGFGFIKYGNEPLSSRLSRLVDFLNKRYYHARWEAGASGARIILGHCPYFRIINEHPELCKMDEFFLGYCSDRKVKQLSRQESVGQGLPQCIFLAG